VSDLYALFQDIISYFPTFRHGAALCSYTYRSADTCGTNKVTDADGQTGAMCVRNAVTDCRLSSWRRLWCWVVFRSIVGTGLSQFRSRTLNITLPFFTRFRNSEDRRAALLCIRLFVKETRVEIDNYSFLCKVCATFHCIVKCIKLNASDSFQYYECF